MMFWELLGVRDLFDLYQPAEVPTHLIGLLSGYIWRAAAR